MAVRNSVVYAPVALLRDPHQTASAKVVWMALRLNPKAGQTELETSTGLSRHTVQWALSQVRALKRPSGGPQVTLPGALLADRSVGPQAKVLYGLLQTIPTHRGQSGHFTYASLSQATDLDRGTVRRLCQALQGAGWIRLTQATRKSPIFFKLGTPEQRRSQSELQRADRRLRRSENKGEALMQEYLSLLIDSKNFMDNIRPGFLINPATGERLELDRFYPPGLAFEYNGRQHYEPTERVSQVEVEEQRHRDLIKAGLCLYEGIQLVIIHAEDLSLDGMAKRLPPGIPRRDLTDHESLIDLLEVASMSYQAKARAAESGVRRARTERTGRPV